MEKLNIIKVSLFKTLLRPLCLILIFLPPFLGDQVLDEYESFVVVWMTFWIIFFILLLNFQKRYSIIGKLTLKNNSIEIEINNQLNLISLKEGLEIKIINNGFKGEDYKYSFPLYFSLSQKEGICAFKIDDLNINYSVLIEKKYSLQNLYNLKNKYELLGVKLDINNSV